MNQIWFNLHLSSPLYCVDWNDHRRLGNRHRASGPKARCDLVRKIWSWLNLLENSFLKGRQLIQVAVRQRILSRRNFSETFLKLFPERRSLRLKLPALSGWCSSLHQHHFQPPIFSSAASMQIGELWGIEIGLKKIWNGLSWMKKGSCGKLVYAELMWWKAEAYVGLRGKEQGPANLRRIRVRKSGIIAIGSCIQKCLQAKLRKMPWPRFMLRCKFWKSRLLRGG